MYCLLMQVINVQINFLNKSDRVNVLKSFDKHLAINYRVNQFPMLLLRFSRSFM